MNDQQQHHADEELARHPTVYAADALKDCVVLISGGAGGIGRAIAWLFARLGAHVVLVGRDKARLDALSANLIARGLKAPLRYRILARLVLGVRGPRRPIGMRLAESGELKPVIDRKFSLAQVPEAIRYLEEGHARGKVVVSL